MAFPGGRRTYSHPYTKRPLSGSEFAKLNHVKRGQRKGQLAVSNVRRQHTLFPISVANEVLFCSLAATGIDSVHVLPCWDGSQDHVLVMTFGSVIFFCDPPIVCAKKPRAAGFSHNLNSATPGNRAMFNDSVSFSLIHTRLDGFLNLWVGAVRASIYWAYSVFKSDLCFG